MGYRSKYPCYTRDDLLDEVRRNRCDAATSMLLQASQRPDEAAVWYEAAAIALGANRHNDTRWKGLVEALRHVERAHPFASIMAPHDERMSPHRARARRVEAIYDGAQQALERRRGGWDSEGCYFDRTAA